MKSLEVTTRALRDAGKKAVVPYLMAGLTPNWLDYVNAAVQGGATTVEIGIPFSDPMMDGLTIQQAAEQSLGNGTTLPSILAQLQSFDAGVPLVAMTYFNIFHHYGLRRSVESLSLSGISGAIVPDLTIEEADEWQTLCDEFDVASVFLLAPSTPAARAEKLVKATQGFCYASARMAVTGKASEGSDGATVVGMARSVSDIPTYVGIGISSPEQARAACESADGAIIGSFLVQAILDGASPIEFEELVKNFVSCVSNR
jgi:tryptophan synthase alpha chain